MRRTTLLEAFDRFQRQTERFLDLLSQEGVPYRVTGASPDDVEFTSSDWDGSAAIAAAPNPSDDEDAAAQLDAMHLLVPEGDDARGSKSNWKLPIREGPDGPVNTNALSAAIAAINGARGGVEEVSRSALESAFETAVEFGVEAGIYEDADDAPDFEPANAFDVDLPTDPDDGGAEASGQGDADWPDVDGDVVTAELTGTVSPTASPDADDVDVGIEADRGDGLVGIVWGAGNHDLSLGGEPTPVHVPAETIPDTFGMLEDDVDAGEVTVGLDHADGDAPVLADTGLIDIAVARDVAMAADDRHIVMTESEFKNDQAATAHAEGAFEGYDFSVVADVAVRTDDDGQRVTTESGRVALDAVRINRIDAVEEGAVEAASIGAIPELAEQVSAAVDERQFNEVADALSASASEIQQHMEHLKKDDFETDPEDLEAAQEELAAAADAVETLQEQAQELEGQAEAFEQVAAAHDVDPEDFDTVEAAAQAVVDAQTADIREDIAEYEAALAAYDTDDESIEDRTEDLAGRSAAELKAKRGNLAHEYNQAKERERVKGAGVTREDKDGHASGLAGGTSGDDGENDELALSAMGAQDRLESEDSDMEPAEYVRATYDVDPSDFENPGELSAAIYEAKAGDA